MKKRKRKIRQFISMALILALVCDQNIANAKESIQQNAASKASNENTTIDNTIQDDNTIIEIQDELSAKTQTEAVFVNEIIDERSENSKKYMMSDKSVTIVMYDEPVHFEDKDGNLVEIDNSLIKTQDGYTNGANTYDVVFSDDDATRGKVDFAENGYGISWQLLEPKEALDAEPKAVYGYGIEEESNDAEETAKGTADNEESTDAGEKSTVENTVKEETRAVAADAKISDDTDYKDEKEYGYAAKQSSILFDGFTNDVSIEYIPQSDGIKENIIMNTKTPYYMHTFSICLKGLTASLTDENEVVFYDAETGEPQYYFPAPFMVDAKGNTSYDVKYHIESGENSSEEGGSEESSSEENSSEEDSSEEDSSGEDSSEENSLEESSSEENSMEEGTSDEGMSEESGLEESSLQEEASKEAESTEQKTEESATEQITEETQVLTETEDKEETKEAVENTALIYTDSTDSYFEIKGLTLSGSAGTSKEENTEKSEPETETEAAQETQTLLESESESKTTGVSEPESESKTTAASEPESESETESVLELESEREPESEAETETETDTDTGKPSQFEQTVTISIIPDNEWLETAEYPVTIDPLLKKSNGVKEITKVSINSSNSVRDTTTLKVGTKNGATYRSFVRFDLPQLPQNCIITSAELTSSSGQTDGTLYIEAHMLGSVWQPSTITWNNQPKSGNRLLDYANSNSYFNITKAVREWYEGTVQNNGVLFKAYDESVQRTKTISFQINKAKPYFKLNYIAAGGTESYWTTHNAAAGTAGEAYINDYLGYLTVINSDVKTAGVRLPMNIRHIYNSCQTGTDIGAGYGWRLNYHQTLKIPTDTVDVTEYPYVWTDEDGTEHYFKKKTITVLQNGAGRDMSSNAAIPPAADEDGLGLYVVPVNDAALKNKYPFKITDKSGSICRYFDKMGRLALITDSNQYENGKNSSTKEKNCIQITYEDAGAKTGTAAYDEALTKLNELKAAYEKSLPLDQCSDICRGVMPYMERLRGDIYATSDFATGKKVYEAYIAVETAEDTGGYSTKKAQVKKAIDAVTAARSNAINLKSESAKRIKSITDAVGNTAVFSYDADGRISAITDPSAPNGGSYNKNASAKNIYRYTGANLTGITYSSGKTASYSYDGNRNLTQMRDHAGYSVNFSYNAKNRVTQVSETGSNNVSGQKYTIACHSDNTNEFRFSGANDVYGDSDDVINTYVFDEKGKTLCEYSVLAGDRKKVIGATAVTYDGDEQDGTDTGNNKIKDSAVVGSHSINYLTNHSFELNDPAWQTYTAGGTLPAGAITAKSTKKHYIGQNCAYFDQTKAVKGTAGLKQSLTLKAGTYTFSGYAALSGADSSKAYLEVAANGTVYKSTALTGMTVQEFDNGWQRLSITFTINSTQKIEVRTAAECTAAKGAGSIAYDCMQLEDGSTANSYNILEDGSFERKSGSDIFQLGWSYEGTGSECHGRGRQLPHRKRARKK